MKTPHLLYSLQQGNRVTRYQPPMQTAQIGDPHSPYWGIVRNGMYGMANLPNGTGYKLFHTAPYQIAAKSGTSQVFSLKQNQTYNAKMIRCGCAITSSIRCSRLTKPRVAMALIPKTAAATAWWRGRPPARYSTTFLTRPTRRSPAIRRKVNRS